jgi:glycosyltransferase involved in cell wall biosynthesis
MDTLEKKKILFLITQSQYGGAQKYVLALARHYIKQNQVLIAVGEAKNQDAQFFAECRALGIEPIVLTDLIRDISLVKAWDALLEIRKLLAKEAPDFLHINSSMAGAIGSCAAWLYRFDPLHKTIRVIYTVHGFVFNEPLPSFKKQVYRLIEKISAGWKGALICVSNYDKEQGIQYKIAPEKRMVVIHNGIDNSTQFLSRAEARAKLALPDTAFILGTIAGLYPTKGLGYLLEAAKLAVEKHPDLLFIIISDGPLRASLEAQKEKLGLSKNVVFKGSYENAASLLKAFDIFVLPSLKEGLPYTILEAGLAGLPVIASRVGGIPEIIQHQVSGLLVEPGNAQDIALALQTLIDTPRLRSVYANALNKKIRSEFSLDRMLRETEKLYLRFYSK